MSPDYMGSKDAKAALARMKKLLDHVNAEDKGCTEKVFRGVLAGLSTPGHLSHLERPNYDFAQYLAEKVGGFQRSFPLCEPG